MRGSSSGAKLGTNGFCITPVATTTLSASKVWSPAVTTYRSPSFQSASAAVLVRTGSSKWAAYASR